MINEEFISLLENRDLIIYVFMSSIIFIDAEATSRGLGIKKIELLPKIALLYNVNVLDQPTGGSGSSEKGKYIPEQGCCG